MAAKKSTTKKPKKSTTPKKTSSTRKSAPKKKVAPKKSSAVKKSTSTSTAKKLAQESPTTTPSTMPPKNSGLSPKVLTISLVVIGLALLTYKLGPWLVPAVVDKRPVTRFEIWKRLEDSYGEQTLDDIVNEYTLEAVIDDSGVKVADDKVKEQLDTLETQFASLGGLDEALSQRGLSREDLEKQIKTQLAVEELLADQVVPSEQEIQDYYDTNKEVLYTDKELDEVKEEIKSALRETKLRDAFLEWFAGKKEDIQVKNFGL